MTCVTEDKRKGNNKGGAEDYEGKASAHRRRSSIKREELSLGEHKNPRPLAAPSRTQDRFGLMSYVLGALAK